MPESQNIEWKESWRDEYLKWICGFANAQGGRILLGVDDTGRIVGLNNYSRLLEDIPNKILQALGIMVDVDLHESGGLFYIEMIAKNVLSNSRKQEWILRCNPENLAERVQRRK